MKARMLFDKAFCTDLASAARMEWLETNGLGGYASSTIPGMNTRRYHGLLVAAAPPDGRQVLLSKLEETLMVDGRPYELSTNRYAGAVHPQGFALQQEFRLDPWPVSTFAVEDVILEKAVFMVQGENCTVVSYRLPEGARPEVFLLVRPLIAFRPYHSLTHENNALDPSLQNGEGWISVRPYGGLPSLYLNHSGAEIIPGGNWYYRFFYDRESERGLDCEEDLFQPCTLRFGLESGKAVLLASTSIRSTRDLPAAETGERRRRDAAGKEPAGADEFMKELLPSADQFLVTNERRHRTVIAGYHWFADWSRDTLISLTGLALVTGRHREAKEILAGLAGYCDHGLLPNRFPERDEEPEYNSVDAPLWFVNAAYELARRTGDYGFVRAELYETLREIIHCYIRGTRFNIGMEPDGLLSSGEPGVQLTWMDAKVGDRVITPRSGKPVEVQALWYNAVRAVEHFAQEFDDRENEAEFSMLGDSIRKHFNKHFWNNSAMCLYDCINVDTPDPALRPNQLFAVSLPFSMLSKAKMRQVVDAVTKDLLTPYGLRSLSPAAPDYRGSYSGDCLRRDEAYHQGTVWSWLMGPYVTARLRVSANARKTRQELLTLLAPLREHLKDAGLGLISEIFDGDHPHAPRGCIGQAWSTAELLRVLDDLRERPPMQAPARLRKSGRRKPPSPVKKKGKATPRRGR